MKKTKTLVMLFIIMILISTSNTSAQTTDFEKKVLAQEKYLENAAKLQGYLTSPFDGYQQFYVERPVKIKNGEWFVIRGVWTIPNTATSIFYKYRRGMLYWMDIFVQIPDEDTKKPITMLYTSEKGNGGYFMEDPEGPILIKGTRYSILNKMQCNMFEMQLFQFLRVIKESVSK
jgi:hypothetical protein